MTAEMSLDEFASFDALLKEHRRVVRRLNKLTQEHFDLEKTITEAAGIAFASMELPRPVAPRTDRRKKHPEVGVSLAADWQLGKLTPTYDSEICEARVKQYARIAQELVEIQREDHPVKNGRLWVLGDIVEGEDIFPGQQHLIDSGLVEQVLGNGSRILRDLIYAQLEVYEKLHVTAVVGNHGRVGRKGVYHPNTNMDRMLYLITQMWFEAAGETRVTFDIPTYHKGDRGWYAVDVIGEYSSLLVHGDQFRGGNSFAGLPYYSFAKKSMAWRDMSISGEMPPFKDIACGHWHRNAKIPIGTMDLRVAGSTESYNAWSIETLAVSAHPSQHMMFVHPEAGRVTSEYKIDLS